MILNDEGFGKPSVLEDRLTERLHGSFPQISSSRTEFEGFVVEHAFSADFGKQSSEGKALLDTNEMGFRGDFRLKIAHKAITRLDSEDGRLRVTFPDGTAIFHLGTAAPKWVEKIRHPPSRLDKMGVKAGMKVTFIGTQDNDFVRELADRAAAIVESGADLIFLSAENKPDLARIGTVSTGATWVIYPKGANSFTENDVIAAGRKAGLLDVKVASFSLTHTALKFTRRRS